MSEGLLSHQCSALRLSSRARRRIVGSRLSLEVLRGLAVTLDDIKTFRQLGSKWPGHPE